MNTPLLSIQDHSNSPDKDNLHDLMEHNLKIHLGREHRIVESYYSGCVHGKALVICMIPGEQVQDFTNTSKKELEKFVASRLIENEKGFQNIPAYHPQAVFYEPIGEVETLLCLFDKEDWDKLPVKEKEMLTQKPAEIIQSYLNRRLS